MPETRRRTIRVPDEVWDAAMKKADRCGTTVTDVVRRGLERWIRRHRH